MLIILLSSITACNKIDDEEINQNILNIVTEIEKSNYELNTLKITYDEYSQNTNKYLSKYITSFYDGNNIIYANDHFLFPITGKHYEEKDWKGLSLEELKKIAEPLIVTINLNSIGYFYNSYDISKIYDDNNNSDTSMHYKHLYIKHTQQSGNTNYTFYKQYTFKREENNYALFSIRNLIENYNKELTYGKEKVEFNENVSLE